MNESFIKIYLLINFFFFLTYSYLTQIPQKQTRFSLTRSSPIYPRTSAGTCKGVLTATPGKPSCARPPSPSADTLPTSASKTDGQRRCQRFRDKHSPYLTLPYLTLFVSLLVC